MRYLAVYWLGINCWSGNFEPFLKPYRPRTGGIIKVFKKKTLLENLNSILSTNYPVIVITGCFNVGNTDCHFGKFLGNYTPVAGGQIKIFKTFHKT